MRPNSRRLLPILALMLCGLFFLTVFCVGGPAPADAFGGFGRMGGFGFSGGPRKPIMVPRRGAGRFAKRPSGGNTISASHEGGRGPGNPRIVGGGDGGHPGNRGGRGTEPPIGGGRTTVSLPAPGGDSGGGAGVRAGVSGGGANNGGSGVPPRGERRFVPDEIITAFSSSATPQSIDQIARRYNLTRLEFAKLPADRQHVLSLAGRRSPSARGRHRHA